MRKPEKQPLAGTIQLRRRKAAHQTGQYFDQSAVMKITVICNAVEIHP
jgi:hypothetical protein